MSEQTPRPEQPVTHTSPLESFRTNLAHEHFAISTGYTEKGGATLLEPKVIEFIQELLTKRPDEGGVMVRKLSDGGYEIVSFRK